MSKKEDYEESRNNLNDKIYIMMNRKDVEAYQKSYEGIDFFLSNYIEMLILKDIKEN